METKPNILLLLFEGLADTVIDSQVLMHASVMREMGIASFEVWAFACDDALYQRSLAKKEKAEAMSGASIRVFRGARPAAWKSVKRNAAVMRQALKEAGAQFSHVHARTEYSAVVAAHVPELSGLPLIWDCRGDAVAELDYRYGHSPKFPMNLMKFLRAKVFLRRQKQAGMACDRAIFVSDPLKMRMQPLIEGKPCEVIPCGASDKLFFFDPELRRRKREELGFQDEKTIYIYVGSLAKYQQFDETVACFSRVLPGNQHAHLLVLTPQAQEARDLLERAVPGSFTVGHASIEEINGYLNAADAAFMLRENTPTNQVAVPTKFAEYCLTGLPVIMTDAVRACHGLALEYGNLIDPSASAIVPGPERRQAIAKAYQPALSRRGQAEAYRKLYG